MDEAEKLRRARRFIWSFRAVFYPGAALLALLMLTHEDGRGDVAPTLSGVTSQSMRFSAPITSDRISSFRTLVRVTCPSGRRSIHTWEPVAGPQLFVWDGRRLHVREQLEAGTATATLDATFAHDTGLVGTMTMEVVGLEICRSGVVSFNAKPAR